jgi:sec-independent protein translocase protein TatC
MMAMPLMVLYEISIIGARIFGKKKSAEEDKGNHGRTRINTN